ncbi:MAG: hypothetical protein WD638_02605 [Nitriliruptoraceae bacterium]
MTRVRTPGSTPLRLAFGARMFTVRSSVAISRGVDEVTIGERYIGVDLDVARDQIVEWARRRAEGPQDP